jgi:hypothetical protein
MQKSHLKRHLDTHEGIKYTCEICKKSYSKAWSLKQHQFSHSSDLPYKCSCGAQFARRDKLNRHKKSCDFERNVDEEVIIEVQEGGTVEIEGKEETIYLISSTEDPSEAGQIYTIHEG